jgi:hypothetical protein
MPRCARLLLAIALLFLTTPAWGDPFSFSTGLPDGRLAAASRIEGGGLIEIETGDDFITTADQTVITSAQFWGLLPGNTLVSSIDQVTIEIYRVFPLDSTDPPDGRVPTRTNSPSDVAFDTRASVGNQLTFTVAILGTFTAANSVLNGIHPKPNQTTFGEGPVSGTQVRVDVTFGIPFNLPPGHYFFVPQVRLVGGASFFWLSTLGNQPPLFTGDLQAWIRDANLDPDWLRIGTDIIDGSPAPTFDMAFSVTGATPTAAPPPQQIPTLSGWVMFMLAVFLALIGATMLRRKPTA